MKKGQEVLRRAEMLGLPRHRREGRQGNPLDGVGAKLSADDIRQWIVDPVAMAKKANSTKKPPMPAKYASCRRPTSTRSSPTCRA